MLHFDIVNGIAVIDAATVLMIPSLNKLYKKFKDPDLRDRVFTYIHVVAKLDPNAPFFGADSEELPDLAKSQYFDEEKPFPAQYADSIDGALKDYVYAFEAANVRALKLFDDKIDQIMKRVKNTEPKIIENYNAKTDTTTFASNIDIITKSLEKIDGLLVAKEKLEAKIRNESGKQGSVRGKKKPSMLERKSMLKKVTNAASSNT